MKRVTLASRLVEARSTNQRKRLLSDNRTIADVGLARALKDECYRVWTSAPAGAQRAAAALETLMDFDPSDETRALRSWVSGIADITRGNLEDAVTELDRASKLLGRAGLEHESAQPQVAKLIALAMLGRYDDARRSGERALKIFSKYNDQLAAGKIELNLSNIVSRRDQYRLAEQYCMSAYRRFRKLGATSWQTMAENGLANTYAELNDFPRAERFYQSALANARAGRMRVTVAEIEASMGNLAMFRGRYADAIRLLELSRQKYESLGMPHQTAIAELEIADIYAELNLNSDAMELYTVLIPKLRRLKLRAEEARARHNFGRVLAATGNLKQARSEYSRAVSLFNAEKNVIAAAAVKIRLATLALTQKDFERALEQVTEALSALDGSGNVRSRLSAIWVKAEALIGLDRRREANEVLKRLLRDSRRAEQPAVEQATLNSLGLGAYTDGRSREAEKFFKAAIDSVEFSRAPLPAEEYRIAFLAKSLEPYNNLTRLYLSSGEFERAFESVERARSRSLLDAVGKATNSTTVPAVSKLREELNVLYTRLSRVEGDGAERLQSQIRRREKELSTTLLRSKSLRREGQKPEYRSVDLATLRRKLGREKALVEFVESDGYYSAFVITDSGIEFVDRIARRNEIRETLKGLHFQFGTLRFGGDAVRAFASQLKTRTDSHLQELYRKLIEPVVAMIGKRHLVIVPAGALNYVPFNALFDGQQYMIESREMVCSPSASMWARLNTKKNSASGEALLVAYADEKIPLVNDEVKKLARSLPHAATFTGKHATFSTFQENAPRADLIHLACHGQFRPDNPMFSSLHLADGWVTVRDVTAHRLRAALVTLSACETGLNEIFAGEELLGLARGFLTAGARSLLITLWTVNDAATARLMTSFYQNLQRGQTIAASLRVAQTDFIKDGEHPYFWAPFFIIG